MERFIKKKETSLARKIVEGFSYEQCRYLYKQESFGVSLKQYPLILEVMSCEDNFTINREKSRLFSLFCRNIM